MRSVIIIPARYASTRFPGKPLVNLLGKPMILWVAELAAKAIGKENVYIATEDQRIASIIEEAGYKFIMTDKNALTGTDRIAEAALSIDADIYLNVQGDEPLLNPMDILKIRDEKILNMNSVINGFCYLSSDEDPNNINIPKVITTEDNNLIYMSRAKIPGHKDEKNKPELFKKQVCIYAFTKDELEKFWRFGRKSFLERSEDIEILRFLELGIKIRMIETSAGTHAVDVLNDVSIVENLMKNNK